MYPKWSILGPFYLSSAICGHYQGAFIWITFPINLSFFYHILSFSPFPLPSSQLSVDWLPISGISALTDIIKCQVQRPIDQKKKKRKKPRIQSGLKSELLPRRDYMFRHWSILDFDINIYNTEAQQSWTF